MSNNIFHQRLSIPRKYKKHEHDEALANLINDHIEDILYDNIDFLNNSCDLKNLFDSLKKQGKDIVCKYNLMMNEVENGTHVGDCTAVACGCDRCYYEGFYNNIERSSPANKHEGWYLHMMSMKVNNLNNIICKEVSIDKIIKFSQMDSLEFSDNEETFTDYEKIAFCIFKLPFIYPDYTKEDLYYKCKNLIDKNSLNSELFENLYKNTCIKK